MPASPESHLATIPNQFPSPHLERASESVEVPNAASQSSSAVIAAVEHPLIRIPSGRILGALEIRVGAGVDNDAGASWHLATGSCAG